MENTIIIHDLGGTPILGNLHMMGISWEYDGHMMGIWENFIGFDEK